MAGKVNILWTKPAIMEFAEILYLLRSRSTEAANKIVSQIRSSVLLLSQFPEMRERLELERHTAHDIVVGQYRIFYDYTRTENKVLILAIFDLHQNPHRIFSLN